MEILRPPRPVVPRQLTPLALLLHANVASSIKQFKLTQYLWPSKEDPHVTLNLKLQLKYSSSIIGSERFLTHYSIDFHQGGHLWLLERGVPDFLIKES